MALWQAEFATRKSEKFRKTLTVAETKLELEPETEIKTEPEKALATETPQNKRKIEIISEILRTAHLSSYKQHERLFY